MALLRIEGNPPCRMVRPWGFMQAWKPAPHHRTMRQGGNWFAFPRFGKDALISNDGAHTLTAAAAEAAEAPVGVARVDWALRRRPVAAVLTSAVEAAGLAVASSGQEDTIAIDFAGELCAVHAIERRPFVGAVVKQLLDIILSRHTPITTPFYMDHVVFRTADI